MMTFVLAAAVLVGALCLAVALDGATTKLPPGVVAHVLAARLLATDHTVPVALSDRRREPVASRAGHERPVIVCEADPTTRVPAPR
jgi:hypothetical protein